MKIAIIGSGISGLSSALFLDKDNTIKIFEQNNRLGGHANTVDLNINGSKYPVETGFIVHNDTNYPNFNKFLDYLNINSINSSMSFSVSVDNGEFEYGSSYKGLLNAKNLLNPKYLKMLSEVRHFYQNAKKDILNGPDDETLGEFLLRMKYSDTFIDFHILPMTASIWSSSKKVIKEFSAKTFLNFFSNHKLLNFFDRPQWKTVSGGSIKYIEAVEKKIKGKIERNSKIVSIKKQKDGIYIISKSKKEKFDEIIFACNTNSILKIIDDDFLEEKSILKDFKFEKNVSILHSDYTFMPKNKSFWSSWNYFGKSKSEGSLYMTYWMNNLQKLPTSENIFLSLNPPTLPKIDKIFGQYKYEHPILNNHTNKAQIKLSEIQGKNNLWFCGAWTKNGFHEDGILSALKISEKLGSNPPWII